VVLVFCLFGWYSVTEHNFCAIPLDSFTQHMPLSRPLNLLQSQMTRNGLCTGLSLPSSVSSNSSLTSFSIGSHCIGSLSVFSWSGVSFPSQAMELMWSTTELFVHCSSSIKDLLITFWVKPLKLPATLLTKPLKKLSRKIKFSPFYYAYNDPTCYKHSHFTTISIW